MSGKLDIRGDTISYGARHATTGVIAPEMKTGVVETGRTKISVRGPAGSIQDGSTHNEPTRATKGQHNMNLERIAMRWADHVSMRDIDPPVRCERCGAPMSDPTEDGVCDQCRETGNDNEN